MTPLETKELQRKARQAVVTFYPSQRRMKDWISYLTQYHGKHYAEAFRTEALRQWELHNNAMKRL